MKPSQIEKRIALLEKKYLDELQKLADEVLDKRIIPYCQKNKVSFMMINGVPRLANEANEYVALPKFMHNLFDISDSNGDKLLYQLSREFKFSGNIDFNKADEKHHEKKYANRSLGSLIFSPAFSMLR